MADRHRRRRAVSGLIGSVLCAILTACTTSPPPPAPGLDPVVAPIEVAIAAINATTDAGVAAQRAALVEAVHPDAIATQQDCRPATITVRIDAVLGELRPDPDWRDPTASGVVPRGTVYRLPARLAIFTDGRRTGTDLTLLHVALLDGRARTFPLCLS